jgi:molybdopterin-guanine dinucleotide biosynthesis protein A
MGRDKAMIVVGGKTMLARAVETLRSIHPLGCEANGARVTVIGDRALLEGADRAVQDRYPGCGPLGGMEAALADLDDTDAADWAFFLPVDMPFLPVELVDALLREWTAAVTHGAMVCHVVVDGRPQPLISLVHRGLRPFLVEALAAGEYRVTPVLQSACNVLASLCTRKVLYTRSAFWQTIFTQDSVCPIDGTWTPTLVQRRSRPLWFANLNTEQDVRDAETFLRDQGSMSQ